MAPPKHKTVLVGSGGRNIADAADANTLNPSEWGLPHLQEQSLALGGLLTLTNVGTSYDTTNAPKALDLATVGMTGFDTVRITAYVNKIGTQNWQLYNVTDTAQVALIADAGALGQKYLDTTVTGPALTGQKTLRVRANSTVSTDDPVYFGASTIFRKKT